MKKLFESKEAYAKRQEEELEQRLEQARALAEKYTDKELPALTYLEVKDISDKCDELARKIVIFSH